MPELSKKLAEVAAFATIGKELIERGGAAATRAFDDASQLTTLFTEQYERVITDANQEKLDRTVTKLRGMMKTYVGDNWEDSVELLEWSGFYFGAALVHWALIANITDDEEIRSFSLDQVQQCRTWLTFISTRIGK
jgi:predicted ATPase